MASRDRGTTNVSGQQKRGRRSTEDAGPSRRNGGAHTVYTVQCDGESLAQIATKFGVTVSSLQALSG
jgi:hypothetical protein